MEHDTGDEPTRVKPRDARDIAVQLRAGLAALGIPDCDLRLIIPCYDITDGQHVRLGTWDPASAAILAEHLAPRPDARS